MFYAVALEIQDCEKKKQCNECGQRKIKRDKNAYKSNSTISDVTESGMALRFCCANATKRTNSIQFTANVKYKMLLAAGTQWGKGKHISIIVSCYGHSQNLVKNEMYLISYSFFFIRALSQPTNSKDSSLNRKEGARGIGKIHSHTRSCRHIEHLYFFLLAQTESLYLRFFVHRKRDCHALIRTQH